MTSSGPSGVEILRAVRVEEVRRAHARGWSVTPLNGKKPVNNGWQRAPKSTLDDAVRWAHAGNVGLRTGLISGVVVVDVDESRGGVCPPELLALKPPTVVTGGGGLHLYFACPEGGLPNSAGKIAPHVDVRGDGGQVVFVGSQHPTTGKTYEWAIGGSPEDRAPFPALPRDLIERLRPTSPAVTSPVATSSPASDPEAPPKVAGAGRRRRATGGAAREIAPGITDYGARAMADEVARVASAGEGTRNDTLNSAAFALGQLSASGHLTVDAISHGLLDAARRAGLPDHEAVATIESGVLKGATSPATRAPAVMRSVVPSASRAAPPKTPVPASSPSSPAPHVAATAAITASTVEQESYNDFGNAERLLERYGDDLRHTPTHGWLVWDGTRWKREPSNRRVIALHGEVCKQMVEEAATLAATNPPAALAMKAWALTSLDGRHVFTCEKIAASLPPAATDADRFDADPLLFTVANGTLNLGTSVVSRSRREDLITRKSNVAFDPSATCPRWRAFIDRIFAGDADLISFTQRAVGYTLTGLTSAQVFFICYGTGANGKSTFLSAVRHVMGDYAQHADFSTFLTRGTNAAAGGARSDLARLAGARFVTSVEPDDDARFSESTLKTITGQDPIAARYQYKSEFEFVPSLKLWLASNHKPRVSGTDEAIWRRIRLIPFTVTIPEAERDPNLEATLREEASGILNWALEGLASWRTHGLGTATAVVDATKEYRSEQDLLMEFIEDKCKVVPGLSCAAGDLFGAYRDWAEKNGERVWSQTRFGRAMSERGFQRVRDSITRRQKYEGIILESVR